jgi:DnaJ-class molecular chaperone
MKPGERPPCYYCGGRGTVQVNEKDKHGRTQSVTRPCPRCGGSGKQ